MPMIERDKLFEACLTDEDKADPNNLSNAGWGLAAFIVSLGTLDALQRKGFFVGREVNDMLEQMIFGLEGHEAKLTNQTSLEISQFAKRRLYEVHKRFP
jgi:hypothetical protein